MRSIKPPYTVTIEITEDADGWHLLTPEAYERRRMAREFIVKEYQTFPYKGAVYEMPELVRCKDCKYWDCDDSESYCDELGIFNTDMNSYCSYAKRKEV